MVRRNDTSIFQQIQRDFTALYPFLKITSTEDTGTLIRLLPVAPLDMQSSRTVAQLVKDIRENSGLSVIIQRKFGSLWIGTSLTADWTLERQNREGEHISRIG
ncbi:MAG TPA: hypothetical protein VK563_04930 [Puia sp.]|nr:hypothetical protein [Puia sp.]